MEIKTMIYAISDIHTEFYKSAREIFDTIAWPSASHLVLAGDIGVITTRMDIYRDFLLLCKQKYKNIVLIPGNHEYYYCNGDRADVEKKLNSLCEEVGVYYIHEKNIVIDGIRFIGHTLWSLIEKDACNQISDFKYDVFHSQYAYVAAHVDGYRFLEREIRQSLSSEEPIVVVTHHLPSRRMIHSKYISSTINSAFASDVTNTMYLGKVKYWFCGHTHEYCRIKAMDTHIIANPRGYPGENRSTTLSFELHDI